MTTILIFDLGDVLVEGFSRVAAVLAQQLNTLECPRIVSTDLDALRVIVIFDTDGEV
jgi:hypothetical protein